MLQDDKMIIARLQLLAKRTFVGVYDSTCAQVYDISICALAHVKTS